MISRPPRSYFFYV